MALFKLLSALECLAQPVGGLPDFHFRASKFTCAFNGRQGTAHLGNHDLNSLAPK